MLHVQRCIHRLPLYAWREVKRPIVPVAHQTRLAAQHFLPANSTILLI